MTKELAQGGAGRVRGRRETLLLQGPPRRLYFLPPFGGGCRARQDPNRVEAGAVRGSLLRAMLSRCARGISVGRQLLARRVETVAEYNVRGSRPPSLGMSFVVAEGSETPSTPFINSVVVRN